MVEVLDAPYVRTAWALGLPVRLVYLRFALKNALISIVTVIGTTTTSKRATSSGVIWLFESVTRPIIRPLDPSGMFSRPTPTPTPTPTPR